jgi:hypothetical protein
MFCPRHTPNPESTVSMTSTKPAPTASVPLRRRVRPAGLVTLCVATFVLAGCMTTPAPTPRTFADDIRDQLKDAAQAIERMERERSEAEGLTRVVPPASKPQAPRRAAPDTRFAPPAVSREDAPAPAPAPVEAPKTAKPAKPAENAPAAAAVSPASVPTTIAAVTAAGVPEGLEKIISLEGLFEPVMQLEYLCQVTGWTCLPPTGLKAGLRPIVVSKNLTAFEVLNVMADKLGASATIVVNVQNKTLRLNYLAR